MQEACDSQSEPEPTRFIGYQFSRREETEIVRIYLNCLDSSRFEYAVDVIFKNRRASSGRSGPEFAGLNELPALKKFHRFIGCLEERAREEKLPRERVFESAQTLLYILSKVKNVRDFSRKVNT